MEAGQTGFPKTENMKKLLILIYFMVLGQQIIAQQVPLFSQYSFNPFLYNPAYAGAENRFVAISTYRNQWTGFNGAPETAVLSVQGPLNGGSAVGGFVFSDVIGAMERYGFNAAYAYRVRLQQETFLSFGLQFGLTQFTLNGNELITHDADDYIVPKTSSNMLLGDATFGIYFHGEQFYAGLSVPQLLNGSFILSDDMGTVHDQIIERHLFLTGGLKLKASETTKIEPSVLLKTVKGAPIQLDFSSRFLFNDKYWLGITYRTRAALCLMAGLQISDHFMIAYGYDYTGNDLGAVASSSHEIMLGWKFNEKKRSRTFY